MLSHHLATRNHNVNLVMPFPLSPIFLFYDDTWCSFHRGAPVIFQDGGDGTCHSPQFVYGEGGVNLRTSGGANRSLILHS